MQQLRGSLVGFYFDRYIISTPAVVEDVCSSKNGNISGRHSDFIQG